MRETKNYIQETETLAALATGRGTGAISTIQVFGDCADKIIKKIYVPAGTQPVTFETGQILIGTIRDGERTIDQVVLGCEGTDTYAINCHGNPLIVEMIMQLLEHNGVKILSAEQLQLEILRRRDDLNSIGIECKLCQSKSRTTEGTKIIVNQAQTGLSRITQDWLKNIDKMSLDTIKEQTSKILRDSRTAKLIIYGCTAVLAGPPNSGKSTLLNYLSGRQKAIVTEIKGTTRDWVTAECQIGSLSLELIDTAGLDELISDADNVIDKTAQKKSIELLEKADLILLVLDNNKKANESEYRFVEKISGKKIITVLNKTDLDSKFDTGYLPKALSNAVLISAKEGEGIESLKKAILELTGVSNFDLSAPVCFTARQENLLLQILEAGTSQQIVSVITKLLNGGVCV